MLTALGPKLHLLATTRLAAGAAGSWLTLGELPEAGRPGAAGEAPAVCRRGERAAGRRIVRRLGGFALAVELVAAWLTVHQAATYAELVDGWDWKTWSRQMAESDDVELRRHNHQRRLSAVLGPVLAGLRPAERRAMEYAALLPPDQVPLPWLRTLVAAEFPETGSPAGPATPTRGTTCAAAGAAGPAEPLGRRGGRLADRPRPPVGARPACGARYRPRNSPHASRR